ncbi:hypothetical protein LCP9604111_8505 [Penicillium roqueforti]|uniref:uncharacterized protein n=1 Tax=Penicillium roqueforti TaxID=5082 RepID=UPI001909DB82|nr:uncharacterized protein LCP9604111_8505 [Penicillium roqueforti]KAF9240965.1 hypothetical protein LCP9604111_8505 [Penicillium roqueforti]
MKEKYAISLGLPISQNATCEITIGSGNQVTTTGTATVPFRLSSENEVHNLEFQLLPNCIHDVIIGKPFLKLTRTFSNVVNFYRRVKKRFAKGISQFHLLYLGASTPMFEGSINGQAYARSIGVHIHTRHEYQTRLKFADNSVTETAAQRLREITDPTTSPSAIKEENPYHHLRITVTSGGCHGFQYMMSLEGASKIDPEEDTVFEAEADEATTQSPGEAKIVMDEPSLELLHGSTVDYTTELIGSQFKIVDNPRATSNCGCGTSFDVSD